MKRLPLQIQNQKNKLSQFITKIVPSTKNKIEKSNFLLGLKIEKIKEFENLILVTPSYGFGELEAHWEAVIEDFKKIDLSGKTLALVGLGSQTTFGESFVGALEVLYKIIIKNGGKIIGLTSTDGYHFEECEAIVENKFMGLVLDEENQDDMTPDRIYEWLEVIKTEFN